MKRAKSEDGLLPSVNVRMWILGVREMYDHPVHVSPKNIHIVSLFPFSLLLQEDQRERERELRDDPLFLPVTQT